MKHERSANTSAERKKTTRAGYTGDFPRRGARSTVSCQSLRRLEVINYANERLMMRSEPSARFGLGEKSSFKPRLARSNPLSRGCDFSDRHCASACGILSLNLPQAIYIYAVCICKNVNGIRSDMDIAKISRHRYA